VCDVYVCSSLSVSLSKNLSIPVSVPLHAHISSRWAAFLPFQWQDPRGNFHALFHNYKPAPVGGHGESLPALSQSFIPIPTGSPPRRLAAPFSDSCAFATLKSDHAVLN
jgi:hypothetical protein